MEKRLTEKEYDERNLQGFEGDEKLRGIFEKLIEDNGVTLVVETGTFKGGTTNQLRQMAEKVITIEISEEYYAIAKNNIHDRTNVAMFLGNSPYLIGEIFKADPKLKDESILFFLDAHWGNVCPLLDEMDKIAAAGLKPVIVIHDFYVPGTTLGYDSYNGRRFDLSFIEAKIAKIYGKDYSYFYNDEGATGARRGVICIEPTI